MVLDGGLVEVALHYLHVVDVVLQAEVVGADLLEDRERVPGLAQVEAGDVSGVDRLSDELYPLFAELVRGEAQVAHEGIVNLIGLDSAGRNTGQAVEAGASEGASVLDGPAYTGLKLPYPLWVAGYSALPRPPLARREVEEDLGQLVVP